MVDYMSTEDNIFSVAADTSLFNLIMNVFLAAASAVGIAFIFHFGTSMSLHLLQRLLFTDDVS